MGRALVAVVIAFVLTGCGNSSAPGGNANPATSTGSTGCEALPGAGTGTRMSPALQQRETMYLTRVDAFTRPCSDTVMFTFRKGAPGPGYDVSYQPAASAKIEDGSGNAVQIEGSAFLVVKFQPAATAEMKGGKLEMTYTGPRRLKPQGSNHVQEIVKTGDFESVVTWVIGLDAKRPFTANASELQLTVQIG